MKIRDLGEQDYMHCWQRMRHFTDTRDADTEDEVWLLEHPSVFTQGQAGKKEHLLNTSEIPIVQSDRGGQITYHGPGQLVAYVLMDLRRAQLTIRELVCALERAVIQLLKNDDISAYARADAPGVYVLHSKICSLGLRVRKGCSYHGLALNVNMDLSPFKNINPCGYANLSMTQLADFVPDISVAQVKPRLAEELTKILSS